MKLRFTFFYRIVYRIVVIQERSHFYSIITIEYLLIKIFRFQNAALFECVFAASVVDISKENKLKATVIGVKLATIRLSEIKFGYIHPLYT